MNYLATKPVAPITNYIYWDLQEWVAGKTYSEFTKRQVLSSMAWNIDNMLINAARTLFFSMHKQMKEEGAIEMFNEYIMLMKSEDTRNLALAEGGMESRNAMKAIRQLSEIRMSWHDMALGADPKYITPVLEDVLKNERPMRVDVLTLKKLNVLVAHRKQMHPEMDAEKMLVELIERQNNLNAQAHESRKEIAPHINALINDVVRGAVPHFNVEDITLIDQRRLQADAKVISEREGSGVTYEEALDTLTEDFVSEHNEVSERTHFHNLDIDTQRTLIERAVGAFERVVPSAARMRKIEVMEFMKIDIECSGAVKELEAVLQAPKFAVGVTQAKIDAINAANGK